MINDVEISFDSTGSMSPAIAEVRRKVESFINTLFDSVDGLRIGLVNHGSYCDGDRLIDVHDLSTDKDSLIRFLRATKNTAGCDGRHASYEYVLDQSQYLSWKGDTRALILIGDCEPHPMGYPTRRYDIPSDGSALNNINWIDRANILVNQLGVKFFPIQALNRSAHTHFYKKLAAMTQSPKLDLMQFSDVAEYLTAVIYSQHSVEMVEEYAGNLQTQGLFNRNISTMINTLLGKETAYTYDPLVTRSTGDTKDLREVDPARFQVLHVDHNTRIDDFVRSTGATFRKGRGFYQLTKSELVQERKEVVLVDKKTGDMWSGLAARDLIGLPLGQRGTVRPSYSLPYDVYIQSTSSNRKLIGHTKFLYEAK